MQAARALQRRFAGWARPRHPEMLPVRMDRHRIYVLPTRFGLFFGVLVVAMALGALNYNNNPALMLALLLAGAGFAALVATHLQLSGLEWHALDAEPATAGQVLALRLHARARDRREHAGIRLQRDDAVAVLNLRDGAGDATLELPTERRGWLDIGRITLSSTRPLGIARAWAYLHPEQPLLVYPAPERPAPPLPHGAGDGRPRRHALGDDLHQLRDYRSGDPRHAIAWKASARHDALLVREFERPGGRTVALDWDALAQLPYEARIRRLAAWVEASERGGHRSVLRLPGQAPIGPGVGAPHAHACLRALALLPHAAH